MLKPHKCEEIYWFSIEDMKTMDLTLTAKHRLQQIKKKYPSKIPNQY